MSAHVSLPQQVRACRHCFPCGGVATLPAYGHIVRDVILGLCAFLWLSQPGVRAWSCLCAFIQISR
eukprot:8478078-Karenia_brevis.AAC.1